MSAAALPVGEADGVRFGFDNSYARLPDKFYARVKPTPVRAPRLIRVNAGLAAEMGLDAAALASPAGVEVLAGNRVAVGSEPLAMAYAGHQFGHFVPQLGDGRANLLGEVVGPDGRRWDVQLKGSGPTPFSRRGDGRAALGPVLREYLVSEAMAAMGVPSTRALAAVLTGEGVVRDTMLPGAVLTRVAASHLRVGSFAYLAARGDIDGVRVLAEYALQRHYPERVGVGDPGLALLEGVIGRQARLVARWMGLGFVHGVMNTDNMSISGETIDYGPCAFLEAYDIGTVFSSIDQRGRYAYGAQAQAAHWNLTRLAEALLSVIVEAMGSEAAAVEAAQGALARFAPEYEAAWLAGMRAKLGLREERAGDRVLVEDLLTRMQAGAVDFTLFFRRLCAAAEETAADAGVRQLFTDPAAYDAWAARWRGRLAEEGGDAAAPAAAMRRVDPAYIPRNHRVEAVLQAAVEREDFEPFQELLGVVTRPFDEQPGMERYTEPAQAEERVLWTFCGT